MAIKRKAVIFRCNFEDEQLLEKLGIAKGIESPAGVLRESLRDSWRDHELLELARKERAKMEAKKLPEPPRGAKTPKQKQK
jgi:hypothetical protein